MSAWPGPLEKLPLSWGDALSFQLLSWEQPPSLPCLCGMGLERLGSHRPFAIPSL